MAFFSDDQNIGGQLKVGIGIVPAIGEGPLKINGSMYSEGPAVFGGATEFITPYATVCIGAYGNSDDSPISSLAGFVQAFFFQEVITVHTLLQCLDQVLFLEL